MGFLYGFMSVFLMSSVPVMNKFVVLSMPPFQGAFINSAISTLVFTLFGCKAISDFRICKYSIGAGVLNAIGLVGLFVALVSVHPVTIGLMGRMGIVVAMVISAVIYRQKPSLAELILGGIALLGAFGAAFGNPHDIKIIGIACSFLSVVSFTGSHFCLKEASANKSNGSALAVMNLFSAIVIGIIFLFSHEKVHVVTSLSSWGVILASTLAGSCMGFWFYLASLKELSVTMATILRATGPLFTAIVAIPFFGYHLNGFQLVSALVLVLAIISMAMVKKRA